MGLRFILLAAVFAVPIPAFAQAFTPKFDSCVYDRIGSIDVAKDSNILDLATAAVGFCEPQLPADSFSVWQSVAQEFKLSQRTLESEVIVLLTIQNARARMTNVAAANLLSRRPK